MSERRLVVVTGSPRSGTTAVGQLIALGRGTCALHEPLNYLSGVHEVVRYFEVPGAAGFTPERLGRLVSSIRSLDLRFKEGIFPRDRLWQRLAKRLLGSRPRMSCVRCRLTPGLHTIVWKDPFVAFCARDLVRDHNVDVLVTVRNPWAVAASFQRMAWAFDLPDLGSRLAAIGVDAGPALEALRLPLNPSALNGAALWNLIYGALISWARQEPRIRFVDLDDIVTAPVETYRRLYEELHLDWSPTMSGRITRVYTRGGGAAAPRAGIVHDPRRDLSSVNTYWRDLLGQAEAEAVTRLNGDLWQALREACLAGGAETRR